jgi:PleD family two-component response regulator
VEQLIELKKDQTIIVQQTSVLIIGSNEDLVSLLIKLVNKFRNFKAYAALNEKDALDLFIETKIDLVLFSSGLPDDLEKSLKTYFLTKNPNTKIVAHYGGGSGLLQCEICEALGREIELV